MPLDLVITPIAAPTLANLSAVATLKGILVTWDALKNTTLFAAELWVSETNDRAAATLLHTCTANYYLHTGLPSNVTRYYWIRAKNIYERTDGAWTPILSTAGVSATTLLTQTGDINPNAVTAVYLAQSATADTQTAYSTWTQIFRYSFLGTGNYFIADMQLLSDIVLATVGTTGAAEADHLLELLEHTVYSAGTVSVTNGSAVVTGSGTAWLATLGAGDVFLAPDGQRYAILSVGSDTSLTLGTAYLGSTLSGQTYYVITATATLLALSQVVAQYEIKGTHCVSSKAPFRHRLPFPTGAGKLYDCNLHWRMLRGDASWSLSQTAVLKTLILEEIKR